MPSPGEWPGGHTPRRSGQNGGVAEGDALEPLGSPELAGVLRALPDGVVVLDHEIRVLWVNERFCELTGWDAAEVIGRNGLDMLDPAQLADAIEALAITTAQEVLPPGDYALLAFTDTGVGLSEEVKARLFEPFFTTKRVGEGAGLGLSTCYGIIKQSGGHISVYSEPGRGTAFKIYLPVAESQPAESVGRSETPELPTGTETILLVEDDPALRDIATTMLRRLGYTVWPAGDGVEAMRIRQQPGVGHVDLLFTDVVLPHMSGRELADRMRAAHPHTRVLYTSTYSQHAVVHHGVLEPGFMLLSKPFTPGALARKVREVMETPAR